MKFVCRPLTAALLTAALALLASCQLAGNSLATNSTANTNNKVASSTSSSGNGSDQNHTTAVRAPDIGGKYNITGTNPNGGDYKGTLEIIKHGDVYQFRWNAGSQYDGVGVQNGNVVAVAYTTGTNGQGCGVVDYDIESDGSLQGKWGYWGTNEAGTENATRTSGSSLEGEYDGTGKNPDGRQYKVKITVEPAGNLYHFVWSNNSEGVGIKRGNNIAVGIGGTRCEFVVYQVQSDGNLDGIWGGGGSDKTGTETVTKR